MPKTFQVENILSKIVCELSACTFVKGIVLGGSRATGTTDEHSDIDIGIYYKKGQIDYTLLNEAARRLDDEGRENLICREGEWGPWVNCGGWLVTDGFHVDLILRDIDRVKDIVVNTNAGDFSANYQTGHPHAYLDVMYRGELASCKILYSGDDDFIYLQNSAREYPAALKSSLLHFFMFETGFSCALASKNMHTSDSYYFTGHIFRSVSALNQAIFALNEKWCLNEKKAVYRIDSFPCAPADYSDRVNELFHTLTTSPVRTISLLRELYDETLRLVQTSAGQQEDFLYAGNL